MPCSGFSLYQKVVQLSRQFQAVFITPERNPIPISHHSHSFSTPRPWEPLSYCLSGNLAIPDISYQQGHLSLCDGFISLHDVFKVHLRNRLFPFLKLNNIPSYSWTTSCLFSSPVFTASCAISARSLPKISPGTLWSQSIPFFSLSYRDLYIQLR